MRGTSPLSRCRRVGVSTSSPDLPNPDLKKRCRHIGQDQCQQQRPQQETGSQQHLSAKQPALQIFHGQGHLLRLRCRHHPHRDRRPGRVERRDDALSPPLPAC